MDVQNNLKSGLKVVRSLLQHPAQSWRFIRVLSEALRGSSYSATFEPLKPSPNGRAGSLNPIRAYFEDHRQGRGIWKFEHYFDIYHQFLSKFVGSEAHIVEVGIYSGGSLGMWRNYLGNKCSVYGVDIQPACKTYEENGTSIFIGDQADRTFWRRFREQVPTVDILI